MRLRWRTVWYSQRFLNDSVQQDQGRICAIPQSLLPQKREVVGVPGYWLAEVDLTGDPNRRESSLTAKLPLILFGNWLIIVAERCASEKHC